MMMNTSKFEKLPFLLAAVALGALTACGGGAGSSGEATSQTPTAPTASLNEPAAPVAPAAPATPSAAESVPAEYVAQASVGGVSDSAPAAESATAVAKSEQAAASTYTTPKVAVFASSRYNEAAYQSHIAKFGMAILTMPVDYSASNVSAVVNGIKAVNPNIVLGQRTVLNDASDTHTTLANAINANKWWLKNAAGSRVQWSGRTGWWDLNLTSSAPAASDGKRYPQWKAGYDSTTYFKAAPSLDFVYMDTVWPQAVTADWKLAGSNQQSSDASVQAATRVGFMSYWDALRGVHSNLKVVGNVSDTWLGTAEMKGRFNGAFLNSIMGASWSTYEKQGWDATMARYRAALANSAAPKQVVFDTVGSSTDYASMRFALASAMLEDGFFSRRATDGSVAAPWFDEYSAQLGAPVDAPPTAATASGVWKRTYENGMVLVNPGSGSATINIGTGYKRLGGTQDPAVNNGASVTSVTLGAKQGLLLVKEPVVAAPLPQVVDKSKPKLAIVAYRNVTTAAMQADIAKFSFAFLSIPPVSSKTEYVNAIKNIRAVNPSIKISQYSILSEANEGNAFWKAKLDATNWWLRNAAGERVQWTSKYGAWEVNITKWTAPDAAGKRYPQYMADYINGQYFKQVPGIDYIYVDTIQPAYVVADWKLSGVDQPKTGDAEAQAAVADGFGAYFASLRAIKPGVKVIGNLIDDWSENPNFKGNLDSRFLEHMMGKSYSWYSLGGFTRMMDAYKSALSKVKYPGDVVFNIYVEPTQYKTIRYAMASAMLGDGHFSTINMLDTYTPITKVDEYTAPIGKPLEVMPTAATASGIWKRAYSNGIVLVNPSKTASATIDVGAGYKRIAGTFDPAVNNGQAASVVTLGPEEGLLLIKSN